MAFEATRRKALGMIGMAPLAGAAAADVARMVEQRNVAQAMGQLGRQAGYGEIAGAQQMLNPNAYNKPKMGHCEAMRLVMADPDMKRLILSYAYKQNQRVVEIDPDIQCLRALSPMAKITFQRQRNVERYLVNLTDEDANNLGFGGIVGAFIQKAMWG